MTDPRAMPSAGAGTSPAFLAGGGKLGALIRAYPWQDSMLGAPVGWPQALKTLVSVMLGSNQPMFVAWGPSRTLIYNDRYSEILADKHPDALGRDLLEVWHEIRADLEPIVAQAYRGEPVSMDGIALLVRGEGCAEKAHFSFSYSPLRDETRQVAGLFCACTEITAQARAEAAVRELNASLETRLAQAIAGREQAEEALRHSRKLESMGQLTGGVAHDFNNLLTPIIGGLDMLQRRGVPDERSRRLLEGALQSAERARILVHRLLAFARRQPLQPKAVDLARLVPGMAELAASTLGPRVRVLVEVAPDTPSVSADFNQLEMAILNLTVNARDAMPGGGTLTIAAGPTQIDEAHRSGLAPGDYVRLSVIDTGIGMDEATLARAVEPFFSTKGIGEGTGLGLSMVQGLAAQLGGALTIDSKPGVGTRVELLLPPARQEEEPAGTAPPEPVRAAGSVLLVEDEALVRTSTAAMLSELGYSVREAASAEEAIALLRQGLRPDILMTDHLMPGMTGIDLARAATGILPELKVLVISGYAEDDGIAPDLARLTKPFRHADLAAMLAELAGGA